MNKIQTLFLCVVVALGTVFSSNAQNNANDKKNKISDKNPIVKNPVRKGDYMDALRLSFQEKLLVVCISGGKGKPGTPEKFTAQQYATLMEQIFKNPKYSTYPTQIAVIHKETEDKGVTIARVMINGEDYVTSCGRDVFTPEMVASNANIFTKRYWGERGVSLLNFGSRESQHKDESQTPHPKKP